MKSEVYRKIMIATDGSKNAKKAVSCGIEIARVSEAKVYAVHVVPKYLFFSMFTGPRQPSWDEVYEILKEEGNDALEYVQKVGGAAGVKVESVLLEGHPDNEIIDFAENNDIDMVVVGTLGLVKATLGDTGIEKFMLGSVAENVIRHSKVQVLAVR